MAPSELPSQDATTYIAQRTKPRMGSRRRCARAWQMNKTDQASSNPTTPRASPTRKANRRRDSRICDQSQASRNATPGTPARYFCHDNDDLGKTIPEFRLTMKRAGLDSQPRPRRRQRYRCGSGTDLGQDQEETNTSSNVENDETATSRNVENDGTVDEEIGLLERDWTEYDEEDDRPCYWKLIMKLNRELRMLGN